MKYEFLLQEVDLEDLSAQLNDQVKQVIPNEPVRVVNLTLQELETLMMDDGDVPSQEEKTMEQVDENTQVSGFRLNTCFVYSCGSSEYFTIIQNNSHHHVVIIILITLLRNASMMLMQMRIV